MSPAQPVLLPPDWRARRGYAPRSARFDVERIDQGWQVVDYAYATVLGGFERKAEAKDVAQFCREYVQKYGDIDLGSMPYSLDEPLHYERPDLVSDWWETQYP